MTMKLKSGLPEKHIRLTREEAAIYLGVKPRTLASWGGQIRHHVYGGRCWYPLTVLQDFLDEQAIEH